MKNMVMHLLELNASKALSSLQVKDEVKSYQAPLKHVAYTLQESFKKELERLKEQEILAPLGVDEMSKWCNSFVICIQT